MMDERELIIKLFETDHLNISERMLFPDGKVRVSLAKSIIKNLLETYGWFPGKDQKTLGNNGGSYLQLELRKDKTAILHNNYEFSYNRYNHKTTEFESVDELISFYLKEKEKEGLDGLKLNWKL